MKNFLKLTASLLSGIIIFVLFSAPVSAVYFGSGSNLSLPKTQKIDESAFIAGETVTIDSDINGDLYCAGRNVTINGNIKGDIICAGQIIKINGIVDGNVRAAAQDIEISGTVTRNVSVATQNLVLEKYSLVKGDIFFGVQQVDLRGNLGRDLAGAGEQVNINGSLLRNAKVTASKLNISDTASISGSLDYYMENTGIYSQANPKNIKGIVTRHEITKPEPVKPVAKEVSATAGIIGKIISIISFALLAFLLIYFTPKNTVRIMEIIKASPVKTFFLGLGVSIIAPFVFILMMITVVGMTAAMVVLLVYIIHLIISSLYSSILVGKWITSKLNFNKTKSLYLDAFIGCVVVGIISIVPVIGWFAVLCLYLSGLGATMLSYLPEKSTK